MRATEFIAKHVTESADQNYLSQIPNLDWKPINRSVWNTIQDEGLDEEQDAPEHTDWVMASLSVDPKDAQALQAFDNDAIEDFNRFDIHLKSRYPGLTDLIDYDRGTVTIVKAINHQEVTEEAKAAKYNGLILKYAFNDNALIMKAFESGSPIAYVKFVKEDKELYPQDLWVNDDYRNRGIAKSMYDYLKSAGYIINRSHDQTKAGTGFWDKHRGEDAYVWED